MASVHNSQKVYEQLNFSTKRTRCPACHSKRGLAPYVGHEHEAKGKCHACGAFTPLEGNDRPKPQPTANRLPAPDKSTQKFINSIDVLRSQVNLECDTLAGGLLKLGIPENHLLAWNLGRSQSGGTLFFYQNINSYFVNCKHIVYKADLHRDRSTEPRFLFTQKQGYSTCLFGENQLKNAPSNTPILIVESEKSTIVASYAMPGKNWLATGGSCGLTEQKAAILHGHKCFIVCDSDLAGRANAERSKTLLKSLGITCQVMDLFPDKDDGFDIGDYFIERLTWIKEQIDALNPNEREAFEERCGIVQHEGGLDKFRAELKTLKNLRVVK